MVPDILLLVFGLVLIVYGADFLVDGASSIARKSGVSEFVIGLTIVGMGTSAPEMVVSVIGALKGSAGIAIGNVVGSNVFNTLLILGLTAVILPIAVTPENRRRDIPVNIAVTALFLGLGFMDGRIDLWDGIIMLVCFCVYIWSCFKFDKGDSPQEEPLKNRTVPVAILMTLAGIAGLVFGGRLFVNSATAIAREIGASEKFIAITILAGGTSLPELATCIAAAVKKKGQLALGNILGSNVFNILLIIGFASVINPLSFDVINLTDAILLGASSLLLLLCSFTGNKDRLDRWEGAVFCALWLAYMIYLIINL